MSFIPKNEDELKLRIAQEHSLQTRRHKPHKEKQKLVSRWRKFRQEGLKISIKG